MSSQVSPPSNKTTILKILNQTLKSGCYSFWQVRLLSEVPAIIAELRWPKGPPSGAPYSYRKEKETHELISHGWLAVLLEGAYA